MIFWDTCALAKCYAALEADHDRALSLLRSKTRHGGSVLLRPEITSAFVRRLGRDRRARDSVLETIEDHLRHFHLLRVDDDQIDRSSKLIRKHSLRAADALHLAAALLLAREIGRRTLRLASADGPQADAAESEGLRVIRLAL